MENKSITSLMSAFGRAYHTENETNPIFTDKIARQFLSDEEYQAIGNYILQGIDFFEPELKETSIIRTEALLRLVNTQISPTPIARSRYCEDSLKTAMMTGTRQYVILGAGLDTFAFREPAFLDKYPVFEVDHPKTQEDKTERIHRAGLEIPANLTFVPVDFSTDNLKKSLIDAGFDRTKKTFFSWLGVSYYLSAEEIGKLLSDISDLAADGSTLLFDYADENLFDSPVKRVQNMLAMASAGGEPMKSCFSYIELEKLLEKYYFLIYELLYTEDIEQKYFYNKKYSAFENICYVQAVLKKLV